MFGAKAAESSSLNGFRCTAIEKAFGPSATVNNPMHKGVDASSFPPCKAELQQHNIFIGLLSWRRCGLVPISRPYINIQHLKTDGF